MFPLMINGYKTQNSAGQTISYREIQFQSFKATWIYLPLGDTSWYLDMSPGYFCLMVTWDGAIILILSSSSTT